MSCLVDTSAWSLLLRRPASRSAEEHPVAKQLRLQIETDQEILLAGIIYQEILQGIRVEKKRAQLIHYFKPFPILYPKRKTHERAAALRDICFNKGVTVSTVEVLLAQLAIENDCALLSADNDFRNISKCSRLRLLES